MSKTKKICEELTALNHKDLSNEMEKVEKVKGEFDIKSSDELMERFDDMLDEVNEDFKFGTLTYSTSRVLKKLDPIAYLQDLDTYIDNMVTDEELSDEDRDKLYDFSAEISNEIRR